jgi:hypothetical protein
MVGAGGDKSSTASANSPMSSAPYTGLFGDNADTTGEEQEIVIWDRLPRHDHVGIEMPSKVRNVLLLLRRTVGGVVVWSFRAAR